MKIQKHHKLFLGLSTLFAASASYGSGSEDLIQQETSRQITRQISNTISKRVLGELDDDLAGGAIQQASLTNKMAASSDIKGYGPDSIWGNYSWTRIGNDGGIDDNFDVDVHQSTVALDKKIGNFFVGASLTYSYSDLSSDSLIRGGGEDGLDTTTITTNGDAHGVTLTPFLAYIINKHLFISALAAYGYSNDTTRQPNAFTNESEYDSYTTEAALNGLHKIGNWFMTGKAGVRYNHGHSKIHQDFIGGNQNDTYKTDNSDAWTSLARAEFGYSFSNKFRLSNAVLFEYTEPKGVDFQSSDTRDGVFYYNIGVDYKYSKSLSLGVDASTDLNNEDVNISTVALNARLAL